MAGLLSEEPFLCPICLEVFTDPVSTLCGHNYCKACITQHWDRSEECVCPLCRTTFDSRPQLSVNKVLSEMADRFRRKQASSPKTHLIITLILNLLLTLALFRTFRAYPDQTAAPRTEDYAGETVELRKTTDASDLQQMIQERLAKIQEFRDSVELSRLRADREMADSERVFAALIAAVEDHHRAVERRVQGFVEELRREIAELEEKSTSEDVHPRPPPPRTRDWARVRVVRDRPSYEQILRTVVERTLVGMEEEEAETEEKRRDSAELWSAQQYAMEDKTFDPEDYVVLAEDDNKQANFSYLQIAVGKQSFSSGRFYYEVEVGGKDDWDLGVATEVINGHITMALSPDSHWAIRMRDGRRCYAAADPEDVLLPVNKELQTVGVFVDYQEGLVSFYDVEARVHLYSFTDCSFTQELYPYFSQYFYRDGRSLETGRMFIISLCSFLVYMYRR